MGQKNQNIGHKRKSHENTKAL